MPEQISFESYHLPAIPAGHYKIEQATEVSISPANGASIGETFRAPVAAYFFVGSERLAFAPAEVHTVFPPPGSNGEHDLVLPHLTLHRSTLPWERKYDPGDDKKPWLALILLTEAEMNDPDKVTLSRVGWDEFATRNHYETEPGEIPQKDGKPDPPLVSVLEFKASFLKSIFPTEAEIALLAHVRKGAFQHGASGERATVVCNRLPPAGRRSFVHLISLEEKIVREKTAKLSILEDNDAKIQLLSLYNWSFTCPDEELFKINGKAIQNLQKDPANAALVGKMKPLLNDEELYRGRAAFVQQLKDKAIVQDASKEATTLAILYKACHAPTESFKGLMDHLDAGIWRYPLANSPAEAKPYLESGAVALPHLLRQGGKTVSWFRGPLIPVAAIKINLPSKFIVNSADQLLLYDENTAMLDVSYAAAWELGRLLTVGNPSMAQKVQDWKLSFAQKTHHQTQTVDQRYNHLPFPARVYDCDEQTELSKTLKRYFASLNLLQAVPFSYLVPNEAYLPGEAIRFFQVDANWVRALLHGAFSPGRLSDKDLESQRGAAQLPCAPALETITGVLLRSDVVSGWPDLLVDAFDAKGAQLDALRFERLSPNVLLCLFKGQFKKVVCHLPPQGLHFGFTAPEKDGDLPFKDLKNLTTGDKTGQQQAILWRSEDRRVVDIGGLQKAMKANVRGMKDGDSGQFAIEMIEGVSKIVFGLEGDPAL